MPRGVVGDTFPGMATDADLAASGGGVDDPLIIGAVEATDHLSVGASPASAGAVRLSNAGFVTARNGDNDDDFNLIGSEMDLEGDHVVIGNGSTDIVFRNYEQSVPVARMFSSFDLFSGLDLRLFNENYDDEALPERPNMAFGSGGAQLLAALAIAESPITDSPPIFLTSTYWSGLGSSDYNASLQHIMLDEDPTVLSYLRFRVGGNSGRFLMTNLGAFTPFTDGLGSLGSPETTWGNIFATLPTTTDPAITGQMFTCTAAELADLLTAGAKHILMSKGP